MTAPPGGTRGKHRAGSSSISEGRDAPVVAQPGARRLRNTRSAARLGTGVPLATRAGTPFAEADPVLENT